MKIQLKNLSKKDLLSKLNDLRMEMIKLSAQISTGTSNKGQNGNIRDVKKNIARIKTKLVEVNNKSKV